MRKLFDAQQTSVEEAVRKELRKIREEEEDRELEALKLRLEMRKK